MRLKRIGGKIYAALLTAALALGAIPFTATAAAAYSDVAVNHWAHGVIAKWSDYGVLQGDGAGNFNPDSGLSLGELAAILSNTFGYTERTEADVTPDWADEYVEKAIAAGVIANGGRIDAGAPLTREQAVRYIALAYNAEPAAGETSFADNAQISAELKPYVNAFQRSGYITGRPGNLFDPKAPYTRAEAMQVLENTTGDILDGSASGKTYANNVIIRKSGVSLKNAVISGDLIIGQGVEEGEVHLENVTVKGNTYVSGGGVNSLYLANFRTEGSLIVRKYEGEDTVRIVVSGESSFSAVVLETGAILVTQRLADGTEINVEIPQNYLAGSKFEFIGDFNRITNNGADADITVTGTVNTLTLNDNATVKGTGRISTVEASESVGRESSLSTRPSNIEGGGAGTIKLPPVYIPSSDSGDSGVDDGDGGTYYPPADNTGRTVVSVNEINASVEQGAPYSLPSSAAAKLNDGTTVSFPVAWLPETAGTSNAGLFVFEGTLTMSGRYSNPSNLKARLNLTVTAASLLTGITVTPPSNVSYLKGEELELTGMTVEASYSDGSTVSVSLADCTVSGYDKDAVGTQTVTVGFGEKTAFFTVTVYDSGPITGSLTSITTPAAISVSYGAEKTAAGLKLPQRAEITVNTGEAEQKTLANVTWDAAGSAYDPAVKTAQTFEVSGTVVLPEGVDANGTALETAVRVTVSAAVYTVAFVSGRADVVIASQTVEHGGKVAEPTIPASVSDAFVGWYGNAELTGEAWDFENGTVTEALTLYAKFKVSLTAAADALTFELIRGGAEDNLNEQSITGDLSLITGLLDWPGVVITWSSDKTSVIAADGKVTRPEANQADAEVTLTAALKFEGEEITKEFKLVVRKKGTTGVEITDKDGRFAPGYPLVTFDETGRATLKVKLNAGVAAAETPVIAYFAMDGINSSEYWNFDKEGVLFGHLVDDSGSTAMATGPFEEFVIVDDNEYIFTTVSSLIINGEPASVGVVLLAGDDLDDPLATAATAIKLTAEQAGYVDMSPPSSEASVFNREGNKLYAYFDERITDGELNANDFRLSGTDNVSISSVILEHSTATGGPHPSWAVVTFTGPVPDADQAAVELTYTNSGTNVIKDMNSNVATSITWDGTVPGSQGFEAYINPYEGTLALRIHPAIWRGGLDIDKVTLMKDGTLVNLLDDPDSSYRNNGSSSNHYFTFAKDSSGTGTYTVAIAGGSTAFAESPFGPIPAQNVTEKLEAVSADNVTAQYNAGTRQLSLAFRETTLDASDIRSCSFILMVDGRRVLIRGDLSVSDTVLNQRIGDIVSRGANVTISHDPNAGGHELDVHGWLTDISGAYVPAFGPVTVSK